MFEKLNLQQSGGLLFVCIEKILVFGKILNATWFFCDRNDENEYISLTDIAKYKSDTPNVVIKNWMRNRETLDFWGYGKVFIILILTPSNSTGLEVSPDGMRSQCHQLSG